MMDKYPLRTAKPPAAIAILQPACRQGTVAFAAVTEAIVGKEVISGSHIKALPPAITPSSADAELTPLARGAPCRR